MEKSMYAERLKNLGTETAFLVTNEAGRLKGKGYNIIELHIGEPDFGTPEYIIRAAKKALDDGYTHYTPSGGLPQFKKSIARYFSETRQIPSPPLQNIIVAPGAKPFIGYTIATLVNPGEEVVYPNPGFPIYESQIGYWGAKLAPLPLTENKQFRFEHSDLEKLVSNKTKIIYINSPHNPTGSVLTEDDLEFIADLAKKYDCWVFSDEVYSQLVYDGEFNSIISIPGMEERTILVDGMSKTFAMTGWRVGFALVPGKLAKLMEKQIINTVSCTAAFTQIASAQGLEAYLDGNLPEVGAMVSEFKTRRDLAVDLINREIEGFSCLVPPGAFYDWVNCTRACREKGFRDSKQLQEYLLWEGHPGRKLVSLTSKTDFGVKLEGETQEYLRVSNANSQDNIREGIRRIRDMLSDGESTEKFLRERA